MMLYMHENNHRPHSFTEEGDIMTCEEFQAQLPELMNRNNIHDHEHLKTCDRCTALIAELETIGEAARKLLESTYEPSDRILEGLRRSIADENSNTA
jgi:hypothetical protein